MVRTGLVVPDELHGVSLDQTIKYAQAAEAAGFDSVWKQEASGSNTFMVLAAIAMRTEEIELGTGVANVYSRSPALLGMSAVTLDRLSAGRVRLGLGVSSQALVERWHGGTYDRPLRRLREAIAIIRAVSTGGRIDYAGEVFDIGPYSVGLAAQNGDIPIYNAAMGAQNRGLTAEFADGWMPVMTPLSSLEVLADEIIERARDVGRSPPRIVPWIPIAVAEDTERAEQIARGHLAQEMAMGYNRLAHHYGYGEAGDEAHDRWLAGDRDSAAAAIDDVMLDDFTVHGPTKACRERLENYVEAGADDLVLWPAFTAEPFEIDAIVHTLGSLTG